jgi:hypothetical protein
MPPPWEAFLSLEKTGDEVKTIPMMTNQHMMNIGNFLYRIRFISISFGKRWRCRGFSNGCDK